MLLLDASALVVVSLARGASTSTQAARNTTAALSVAARGIEASIATTCQSGNANGHDALPSGTVTWTERTHGRWREREVQASLLSSALTGARTTTLTWRAARLCP